MSAEKTIHGIYNVWTSIMFRIEIFNVNIYSGRLNYRLLLIFVGLDLLPEPYFSSFHSILLSNFYEIKPKLILA